MSYIVHVQDTIYGLIPNSVNVPTVATVNAAIGSDPNLQQLGPCNDGDAGTEVIWVRHTIVIPFAYVNVFLANDATPRIFWESIYPQIVTDGHEADTLTTTSKIDDVKIISLFLDVQRKLNWR